MVYKREWYHKILIVKKCLQSKGEVIKYLETDDNCNKANNQTTYVEAMGREYREFKLIEIENEVEVIEHMSFIHPVYPG